MSKTANTEKQGGEKIKAWRLFCLSFFPVLILCPALPAFLPACGRYSPLATALGLGSAATSCLAFICCPRRCWLPKLLTLMLLLPAIGLGLDVLKHPFGRFLAANPPLNRALTALVLGRR